MAFESTFLGELLRNPDLGALDFFEVSGIQFFLPLKTPRGAKRVRDWQRRLLPDLVTESINADALERTPFRILYGLTTNQKTKLGIKEALQGELAPLEPLFRAETETSQKKMTLAFHVLAVKAADTGEPDAKGFTERTIVLLCRQSDGQLNTKLLRRLIEEFRKAPSELDLAQRTLLERIEPNWHPDRAPKFDLNTTDDIVAPFDPIACTLFQEDLECLLDAKMSPPDFFQNLNLLLILHLGLFQPRAAALLNPQMELLEADFAHPSGEAFEKLEYLVSSASKRHPFAGSIDCWAADDGRTRRITPQTPALLSFERVDRELQRLHFSVLTLVQLRRIAEAYIAHSLGRGAEYMADTLAPEVRRELHAAVQAPLHIVRRMHNDSSFRAFLERALTVLCARFIRDQIPESDHPSTIELLRSASSPFAGLRRLYERYNNHSSSNPASSRAYRQGTQVVSGLLSQGEYGLVQGRRGVGRYFEIGAGLLPLLLLLAVTPKREKVPIERFWKRLEQYGLALDKDEKSRLLERLRSMGVYERYSDAGDSAYVRNLIISVEAA